MTVAELKAALDDAGIDYPADARKADLADLLDRGADAVVEAAPAPHVTGSDPIVGKINAKISKLIDYRDRQPWRK